MCIRDSVTALALLSINWFYAFLGCVVRGVIAGWLPAFVFKIAAKKSETVGAVVASVLAPIINTGIFSLCVFTIFEPYFTDVYKRQVKRKGIPYFSSPT